MSTQNKAGALCSHKTNRSFVIATMNTNLSMPVAPHSFVGHKEPWNSRTYAKIDPCHSFSSSLETPSWPP